MAMSHLSRDSLAAPSTTNEVRAVPSHQRTEGRALMSTVEAAMLPSAHAAYAKSLLTYPLIRQRILSSTQTGRQTRDNRLLR